VFLRPAVSAQPHGAALLGRFDYIEVVRQ